MPSEVTVTVKNEEKKLVTNHLIYEIFTASENDPIVRQLIDDTVKQFKDEVQSVRVKINLEIQ